MQTKGVIKCDKFSLRHLHLLAAVGVPANRVFAGGSYKL